MQIFSVGGFVRDTLLRQKGFSIPEGDRDWVVVGSTPEEMISQGFIPVGNDFPVFLHPTTHEEYALARTERKTAPGYHGFVFHTAPTVTLEEDLRRRDLTINAIAMNREGKIFDPFNGRKDLDEKILRHVSSAFSEDPVRILRVARFAARFPSFRIAPETMALMCRMVFDGEADALVPERIWAEFFKAMSAPSPIRFTEVLLECALWQRLFPNLPEPDDSLREALGRVVKNHLPEECRLAVMFSNAESAEIARDCLASLKAPVKIQQYCEAFMFVKNRLPHCDSAESIATVFEHGDALRRTERMKSLLILWEIYSDKSVSLFQEALGLWCGVNAGEIAKKTKNPSDIPRSIREARLNAISVLF